MNYRIATLQAQKSIATAATERIDIDVKDPISRIVIRVEVTNNGYVPVGHPAGIITRLQIVDGSQVIASLKGYAVQAMHYYNNSEIDHNELNYEDNAQCRASFTLDFGRWLWDELFALDPSKFRNLQLVIEHNYALGGCSPDAATLAVFAMMFDEKQISPGGYMLNREIYSYTPTAGAAEYINLPTDDVIRKILMMNVNDTEEPDVQFESVKVDEEDGKRIIFDGYTMDLLRMMEAQYSRFGEYLSGQATTSARNFYMSACKDLQLQIITNNATCAYFGSAWSGGRKRDIRASATALFGGVVSGRCPHGAVPILFGQHDNENDWWDVTRIGKARLTLVPRAAGCSVAKPTDIVVQFCKRY